MRRVAVGGEADDFTVNRRPSGFGMLQLFQHKGAGAFANHQSVTGFIERRRCGFRLIVTLAGREQRIENSGFRRTQLFSAAGHHDGLIAVTNRLPGIANRLAAGGAGAGGGNDPPAQAEEQAGVHCGCVRHHLDVGSAGDVIGMLFRQHGGEFADRTGAAGRGAVGNTGFAIGENRLANQSGLFQRQFAGAGGHQRDAAHGANTLARIVLWQGEIVDRRAE